MLCFEDFIQNINVGNIYAACNFMTFNSQHIKILTPCKFLSLVRCTFLSRIPFIQAGPVRTLAFPPTSLMFFWVYLCDPCICSKCLPSTYHFQRNVLGSNSPFNASLVNIKEAIKWRNIILQNLRCFMTLKGANNIVMPPLLPEDPKNKIFRNPGILKIPKDPWKVLLSCKYYKILFIILIKYNLFICACYAYENIVYQITNYNTFTLYNISLFGFDKM